MLYDVLSANHTAPSAAAVMRPRRAFGVPSLMDCTSPVADTATIETVAASVTQTLPAVSTAMPIGSVLREPLANRSTFPARTTPTASEKSMLNQTLPSGATATAVGMSVGTGIAYSITFAPRGPNGRVINIATPAPSARTIAINTARR